MTATTQHEPAGLEIQHLTKIFGGSVRAIDDVSLSIQPGELVSFLGPSGCGKTTTLNCIAGLEHPDQGVIRVGDFTMTDTAQRVLLQPEERGLGMVFQSYALWPHMTVADNIGFG
ncbi:putrescine/spermidine ABC transporter ATPase, partial [Kouleothrix aurantiaca]